jgi:dATP pyrophosphohydrolase
LLLRNAKHHTWGFPKGKLEPGEDDREGALRELREETGVDPDRLYNVSRVESFYLHRSNEIALIPVFAAFVGPRAEVRLSTEHDHSEWLTLTADRKLLAWPREHRALADIETLLAEGNAGALEDVLRVSGPGRASGPHSMP